MALSGLHVACVFAGGRGVNNSVQDLVTKPVWSETLATAATTTNSAPNEDQYTGQAVLRVTASADAFIAIGPTPNASTGARLFVRANTDYDIIVKGGDKLAWVGA